MNRQNQVRHICQSFRDMGANRLQVIIAYFQLSLRSSLRKSWLDTISDYPSNKKTS